MVRWFLFILFISVCSAVDGQSKQQTTQVMDNLQDKENSARATFGAGCFWCTEAVFLNVKGVSKVVSGYAGGKTKNPTYEQVTSGTTGHAEVAQIIYNPSLITYEELLEIFWNTHDPTTLNRQGADVGTQYRSAIFYQTEEEKKIAHAYKQQLERSGVFKGSIVTEITLLTDFYPAENYHQNYYALNPNQGYCQYVIRPKVEKFKKQFAGKLKEERPKQK